MSREYGSDYWLRNPAKAAVEIERLRAENAELRECYGQVRQLLQEAEADRPILDDGFGNVWALCGEGCQLQIVRPGKAQCDRCGLK